MQNASGLSSRLIREDILNVFSENALWKAQRKRRGSMPIFSMVQMNHYRYLLFDSLPPIHYIVRIRL